MSGATVQPRYEMVNVRLGHVIIEQDMKSPAVRSYFSAEPTPPIEEYWEGRHQWRFRAMAQSMQFDVREAASGEVVPFNELLGLLYYGCCAPESDIRQIGDLAHEVRVSLYVAITYPGPDGSPTRLARDKAAILNRLFNDRLRDPRKRILILPDMFGLYETINHGQIMIDFGLTALEEGR